ncbi:DUF4118 domain-containing protein [Nocardioides ferulae]|uniref:DUF4118 domain-containing protein n=1 Tax=Nocardioides ferulae TaxID=2340821 RepID=UPI000EAEE6E5|nr:DUF4118 domain-containing protein [Nocardioides ferulae]
MRLLRPVQDPAPSAAPWFLRHPVGTLAVASALFATVIVLRFVDGDAVGDVVSMLYVLPVALIATAFGRKAGLGAGLVAVALVGVWVLAADVDLSWVGWTTRIVPLVLVGLLIGDAAERQAAAEQRQLELEAAAQRHRDAAQISDNLIQGMSAAKWALEAERYAEGLGLLEATLEEGHKLVSDLLREADLAPGRPTKRD